MGGNREVVVVSDSALPGSREWMLVKHPGTGREVLFVAESSAGREVVELEEGRFLAFA